MKWRKFFLKIGGEKSPKKKKDQWAMHLGPVQKLSLFFITKILDEIFAP